ncbi:LapA family protein [Kocuria sp. cx-455]|uniref:LapA family protein n=1 Tax=Kocuria sp. cx-455 TaxID=2771377 RepID=UPI003D7288CD
MTQHPQEPVQPRPEPADSGASYETGAGYPGDRHDARDRAASSVAATRNERQNTRTARATDPTLDGPTKRGVSGIVWAALILGVIILILLLIFIIQNNVSTRFEYMAWQFSLPLGVAMLLSAVAGALVMALVGSVRMLTLSHRVRKLEKERARIQDTLNR